MPLATAVGFGAVLVVGCSARTLLFSPDVTLSQKRRGSLMTPGVNDDPRPVYYHDHWLRNSRSKPTIEELHEDASAARASTTTMAARVMEEETKAPRFMAPGSYGSLAGSRASAVDQVARIQELNRRHYNGAHVFGLHRGIYGKNPRPQLDMQVVEQL